MGTPRSDERGVFGRSARPDEGIFAGGAGLGQRGVDGSREARIVQLDRDVVATFAAGLLPGGTDVHVGGADAEVGGLVAFLLDGAEAGLGVEGERLDDAGDLALAVGGAGADGGHVVIRSDEHTSELQSLMRISYAVFCF